MTTFFFGQPNVRATQQGSNEVVETAKKYKFYQDTSPRYIMKTCTQTGWDTEDKKNEKCGSHFTIGGCKCHPDFCPDCSAEVHHISLTNPGVMEESSLLHHCTTKGTHG